ncbi:4-hydroxy-tetrahydrodipicolinate reductase [Desulfovibrio sp. OttesenSCG-928-A18]|nr:4-hydroxy-tetrahydrodipicolinate reductase [Desulfovibrio sp. OttesenSCG-928-A18]
MQIPVIVMGAAGRMGSTMCRLVREFDDLQLAGAVERPGQLDRLAGLPCAVSSDVTELMAKVPGAVLIDFTAPSASLATARAAAGAGCAHVIGTTGFSVGEREELEALAKDTPLFWSPNMSIGVNVLLQVLPLLTQLLGEAYDIDMMEIHHNKKKDSPSGTALRLAEAVAESRGVELEDVACYCRHGIIGERPQGELGIQAIRGGDVVGVHTVYFMGPGERIELTHQAHSRENFANGALRAVRWLHGREAGRLYSMRDILG